MATSPLTASSASSAAEPIGVRVRLRRYLRPPRKLVFTRQGRWFTGMTFLVGVGAINTGNNLLYLLLGMMLGLITVSGVMSEAMLRRLEVRRLPRAPFFAGAPGRVEYVVHNGKRLVPSFSIEVIELEDDATRRKRLGETAPAAGVPSRRGSKRARRTGIPRLEGLGDRPRPEGVPGCLVHRVAAGRSATGAGQVTFPERGVYRYHAVDLCTRFPFGFFRKARTVDLVGDALVFPRVVPPPAALSPGDRPDGVEERPMRGRGLEFLGLRDYAEGEDWRSIHWKVSARRGSPVVRETQREESRTAVVALSTTNDGSAAARTRLERAIEVAAACSRALLEQGYSVGLRTPDGELPPSVGSGHLHGILSALALLEPTVHAEPRPLAGRTTAAPVLLVTPAGTPPPPGRFLRVLAVDATGVVSGGAAT